VVRVAALPAAPRDPALSRPLASAVEQSFEALSAARGRRILHPQGIAFRGTLLVEAPLPGTLLAEAASRHQVLGRFSRALGTPRGRADFLGLAMRIDGRQDVLLAAGTSLPLVRYLPRPARRFDGTTFTSLLPLRAGPRVCLLGARVHHRGSALPDQIDALAEAAARGPLAAVLAVAPVGGSWRRVGTLELAERVPPGEALAFDPWLVDGGVVPWGRLNALRAPAYRGSRRGRAAR
jgi:hypothetical protein